MFLIVIGMNGLIKASIQLGGDDHKHWFNGAGGLQELRLEGNKRG